MPRKQTVVAPQINPVHLHGLINQISMLLELVLILPIMHHRPSPTHINENNRERDSMNMVCTTTPLKIGKTAEPSFHETDHIVEINGNPIAATEVEDLFMTRQTRLLPNTVSLQSKTEAPLTSKSSSGIIL